MSSLIPPDKYMQPREQSKYITQTFFFPLVEETWRGKESSISIESINPRTSQSMLNPTVGACKSNLLLENGNFSNHGEQETIRTINTCSFDSVFTAISALYADHPNVKHQIDEMSSHSNFLSMIVETFPDVGIIPASYGSLLQQRNTILGSIFVGNYDGNVLIIDCLANVNYLIPKLLPAHNYSYFRKKRCGRCGEEIQSDRCFVDINIDDFAHQSIQQLNTLLINNYCPRNLPSVIVAEKKILKLTFRILL